MLIPILVLAAGVAQGFGRFGYALLLPAVNADLVHSYAVAGLLGTLNLTAYLAGTLLVSLTAGRLAPATSVRLGLLLTTAGVSVLALAPSVPVLVAGMVLAGFGGAMIWVPAPGIAGSAVHVSRRGLAIGLTGSGVGRGGDREQRPDRPGARRRRARLVAPGVGDRGGAVRARGGRGGALAAPARHPGHRPGPHLRAARGARLDRLDAVLRRLRAGDRHLHDLPGRRVRGRRRLRLRARLGGVRPRRACASRPAGCCSAAGRTAWDGGRP